MTVNQSTMKFNERLLAVIAHEWKDREWVRTHVATIDCGADLAVGADVARIFPELALDADVLARAWRLYEQGMFSSQLAASRNEVLFVYALLGLRKSRPQDPTLASAGVWSLAMDYGKEVAERLVADALP